MFSKDENIESIAQLIEILKHYIGLQAEYMKFDVIEKTVRLLTAIALVVAFCVLVVLSIIPLSFALAYWLGPIIGMAWAFAAVGIIYLLLIVLLACFRHRLIERPLVRFLANLLLSK